MNISCCAMISGGRRERSSLAVSEHLRAEEVVEERKVSPDRLVDSHPVDHEALPAARRLARMLVNDRLVNRGPVR
jgi:hypothetical protein